MLPLPRLSPVGAKKIIAQFDGGLLSSDAGVLVLREVEQRLRVAERMAACIADPRAPEQITHTLADIICFRLLMIAGGYEDGNDANSLRVDLALAHPEPIQVADLREGAPSAVNEVILRAGFRALLVAPLLRGENIVGVLVPAAARLASFRRISSTSSRHSRRNRRWRFRTPGCSVKSRIKGGSSKWQDSTNRSFSPI